MFPNLSHMNSFHIPLYSFKAHFSIILTSIHRPSKLSLSFRFSLQNPVRIYFLCMLHALPICILSCEHRSNIWRLVQVMKLLIMQFSSAFCFRTLKFCVVFLIGETNRAAGRKQTILNSVVRAAEIFGTHYALNFFMN